MTFKEEVYNRCVQLVDEKIALLQKSLRELTESAANETKSTAGDKHETALAMLQIEQENTGRQLNEALLQKLELKRINVHAKATQVVFGSLVKTNKGFFFLSIPLGKAWARETLFIGLSAKSPLGKALLGLKLNDISDLNGNKYVVEEIT